MEIGFYKSPWQHFVVSDFVNQDTHSVVSNLHEQLTGNPTTGCRKTVTFDGQVEEAIYSDLKASFLSLLNEVGLNNIKGNVVVEFDALGTDYKYHPHTDIGIKLVSFVYHVSEQGSGTKLLANKDGPVIKTLPWVVNGGGGFIRTNNSWHTFDNVGFPTVRRTVLFTLRKQA